MSSMIPLKPRCFLRINLIKCTWDKIAQLIEKFQEWCQHYLYCYSIQVGCQSCICLDFSFSLLLTLSIRCYSLTTIKELIVACHAIYPYSPSRFWRWLLFSNWFWDYLCIQMHRFGSQGYLWIKEEVKHYQINWIYKIQSTDIYLMSIKKTCRIWYSIKICTSFSIAIYSST